jgi:pilus assembly protein Flp/PilA
VTRGDELELMMTKVLKLVNAVRKDEEGAALVEYALLIGLIAVVCIIVVTQLGLAVSGKLNTACTSLGGSSC